MGSSVDSKNGVDWVYRMFTGGSQVSSGNAKNDFLMACTLAKQMISQKLTFSGRIAREATKELNDEP
jgi:hypothetical protein